MNTPVREGETIDRGVPYHAESTLSGARVLGKEGKRKPEFYLRCPFVPLRCPSKLKKGDIARVRKRHRLRRALARSGKRQQEHTRVYACGDAAPTGSACLACRPMLLPAVPSPPNPSAANRGSRLQRLRRLWATRLRVPRVCRLLRPVHVSGGTVHILPSARSTTESTDTSDAALIPAATSAATRVAAAALASAATAVSTAQLRPWKRLDGRGQPRNRSPGALGSGRRRTP